MTESESSPAPVLSSTSADGAVVTLTLNRPRVGNAYNGHMIVQLLELARAALSDESVRVLVLRGNGRHFQAGADLAWLKGVRLRSAEENIAVSRRTALLVHELNLAPKPTLALVHGTCFGGGVGMLAACDVVIAERTAGFAITEARWGLLASIIVPQLNSAMGARQVRRYALTGERFGAERAMALGLVHETCEPGALDVAATPVIDGWLRTAPQALAESKLEILRNAGLDIPSEAFESRVLAHAAKRQSEEAEEGLLSFLEKRDPSWYPSGN
ncbi:MAG: enoyl-CoA hydratase-related protein [Gammaproteobacteria bacterium]